MTRQEASEIFQMIAVCYDLHPQRAEEQAPLWVQALEPLRLDDVLPFVQQFLHGRGPDKFPNLVVFVGMVRAKAKREDAGRLLTDGKPRVYQCGTCGDTGQVEIGVRRYQFGGRMVDGAEQIAPCPSCDAGKLMEHPLSGTGPWGPDGYWRGQQWKPGKYVGVVEIS